MKDKTESIKQALLTVFALAVMVVIFGVFLMTQGVNPIQIYGDMIVSTLGNSYGIGQVVVKSSPFIMVAVATAISAKAGLVNVGGEGQLAIGALLATFVAVFVAKSMPGPVGILLMLVAGALGGAVWSGLAGLMKVKAGMNETLTTVIMNYIAYDIVSFFVYGILKDPESFSWPMSPEIADKLRLPEIYVGVSIGIFGAVAVAIVTWLVLKKSACGFRLRVIGGNAEAAKHAGFSVAKIQMAAMLISGAISGIAGMVEIAGVEGRLRTTTGVNYGYYGFLAAWMAWNNPLAAIITSVVIGFLCVAGNVLEQSSGLPSSGTKILMALVLLGILWKGKGRKKCS